MEWKETPCGEDMKRIKAKMEIECVNNNEFK